MRLIEIEDVLDLCKYSVKELRITNIRNGERVITNDIDDFLDKLEGCDDDVKDLNVLDITLKPCGNYVNFIITIKPSLTDKELEELDSLNKEE
jgi:hypothetical protein